MVLLNFSKHLKKKKKPTNSTHILPEKWKGGNTQFTLKPALPWYQNEIKKLQENYLPVFLMNTDGDILTTILANQKDNTSQQSDYSSNAGLI